MKRVLLPKTITVFILIASIFVLSLFEFDASAFDAVYLVDASTDLPYTVSIKKDKASISGSAEASFFLDSNVFDCCVAEGVFYFLSYTADLSGYYQTTFYAFDLSSEELFYYVTPESGPRYKNLFTADGRGNVYFCDGADSSLIYCYHGEEFVFSTNTDNYIYQISCFNSEEVLLFSMEGVYSLEGKSTAKLNTKAFSYPLCYVGNDSVADSTGKVIGVDFLSSADAEATIPYENSSADSNISVKGDCVTVPKDTTVAVLRKYFGVKKEDFSVKRTDGKLIASGKLGTGMRVSFKEFSGYIIVTGELTGEGNINSRDIKALMKHLSGEESLSSVPLLAADVNSDGKVNTKDLLMISRMY
ncbi:MAG: dockerin type I repeat-containing protein [Ruminococcus sp.]